MQSARGRSFLQEYALRNRVANTETLLSALGRIEGLLTARALEPPAPSSADAATPAEAGGERRIEPAIIAAWAAAPDVVEIDIDVDVNVDVDVDVGQPDVSATAEIPQAAIEALEGTALHALAIEFLGPQPQVPATAPVAMAPVAMAPQHVPAKPAARDPFADIRALSDIEKIALFT